MVGTIVKKARYIGAQATQFNTYVTLKLQNVKSTTVTVKGANPCWEQDFLFETNDLNTGLLIEVWSKGMIWDRAMGYHWIPLEGVQYANEDGNGQWLSLEGELEMRDGEVVGTKSPTGHSLLVDCRFELPFDPENTEAADLQRKLEMLNNIMDQEARAEQARRQMQYFGHSGYSEDSDYTSDLNYPVGQHANSSASQFRSVAGQLHTPQRSLETSRENSYEREDIPNHHQHHLPTMPITHQHHLSPGYHHHSSSRHHHNSTSSPNHHQRYSPNAMDYGYNTTDGAQNSGHQFNESTDSEPLFYNSRPRNNYKQRYTSQDQWYSAEYGSTGGFGQQSVDSVDAALGRGYSGDSDYYGNSQPPTRKARGGTTTSRRPSLERQTTLYDDQYYNTDNSGYYPSIEITDSREQSFNHSYDEYFETSSYPYQEERYGQDEEDRQWDSGGFHYQNKSNTSAVHHENHINKRRNSVLPQTPATAVVTKSTSYYQQLKKSSYDDEAYPTAPTPSTTRRRIPQIPQRRSASRQGSLNDYDGGSGYDSCRTPENTSTRGASLPPTPTTTPKLLARLGTHTKPSVSLPPTPGRQLPKPNLNHRSAKARRNNLMKRTSSADYAEIDQEDVYNSYYMRPGAMSATQMYNEDYNYAYQSIDNLPAQPDEQLLANSGGSVVSTAIRHHQQQQQQPSVIVNSGERRTSLTMLNSDLTAITAVAVTTAAVPNDISVYGYPSQHQQQSSLTDEYYYSAQEDDRTYLDEYDYDQQEMLAATAARKKRLGRRENSPLLLQNTDSLESRDDDLKDSFETAVSSISSSMQHRRGGAGGYSEYSTAGDTLSTSTTSAMALPVDSPQKTTTTAMATVTTTQYNRDQSEPPKAIVSVNGANVRDNVDNTNANANNTSASSLMMSHMTSAFSAVSAAAANAVAAVTNNSRNHSTAPTNNSSALANNNTMSAMFNNSANSKPVSGNRAYLKQQDSLDRGYFKHQESLDQSEYLEEEDELLDQEPEETVMLNDKYKSTDVTERHYLDQQESIESYTEELTLTHGSIVDEYNGKGTGKESPVSVIHVESYDAENVEKVDSLRVSIQNQQSLMDPYHPALQRQLDPYAPAVSVRRASIDPYRPISPSRRTSGENYQLPGSRKPSIVDQYGNTVSRKSSLDPYQPPMSRRTSIRHSPTPSEIHKQDSIDQISPTASVIDEEEPEKKNFIPEVVMSKPSWLNNTNTVFHSDPDRKHQ
ncbi:hypothetical protein CBL_07377 [Carabus blaptoides fortunei]